MANSKPSPCNECPFRRTSWKGYVGPHASANEILTLVHYDGKFPCHVAANKEAEKPENRDKEFAEVAMSPKVVHCVGSLAYRNNTCKRPSPHYPEMTAQQEAAGKRDDVFRDPMEMMQYHDGQITQILPPGMTLVKPAPRKQPRKKGRK